jgi:hypothetical protein
MVRESALEATTTEWADRKIGTEGNKGNEGFGNERPRIKIITLRPLALSARAADCDPVDSDYSVLCLAAPSVAPPSLPSFPSVQKVIRE